MLCACVRLDAREVQHVWWSSMHGGPACTPVVCRGSGIVGSAGGMPIVTLCASLSFSLCASGVCVLCVCVCVGSRTGAQLVLLRMDPGVWSVDVLALL